MTSEIIIFAISLLAVLVMLARGFLRMRGVPNHEAYVNIYKKSDLFIKEKFHKTSQMIDRHFNKKKIERLVVIAFIHVIKFAFFVRESSIVLWRQLKSRLEARYRTQRGGTASFYLRNVSEFKNLK